VIDIHCHILPEVDDGPKSWDISREMCRMAVADGIEHIVATPHANERYGYDREYLVGALEHLRQLVGGAPRLSLGCDFHFSYDNLQDVLACPDRYTIEGSPYLLVELSNYSIPVQINECFTRLGDKGITPVITHPERNPILQQTPQRVLQWVEQGCVVQVTASALTGSWGERGVLPSGCSSAMPCTCWPATPMTFSTASRCCPQLALRPKNSAARKSRTLWSTATLVRSLAASPCPIFLIP
jgi:protein-tyrosine phosphatase